MTQGGLPSAADFVKKAKALDLIITEKGAKDKELASFAIKPQEFGTGSYGCASVPLGTDRMTDA